jgi:hypothetical protein
MKKLFGAILCVCLAMWFTGCGSTKFSRTGEVYAAKPVRAAHDGMNANERTDDLGITIPMAPVSHPGRRYPATMEFPTGPDVGERLPEFTLPNQDGEVIDFHKDRGTSKAIVVFYRSAVW